MSTELTMATLPTISDARLPDTYANAVVALEQATAIDECQSWADKAMALASYARQSSDDRLHKMAIRIQARAIRRCGDLLAQVPPAPGGRPSKETHTVDDMSLSRERVASDAGMSKRQKDTALRVAAVPRAEFEAQVESAEPPTVTKLAEQGKKTRPLVDLEGIPPEDFRAATELQGLLRRLAEYCQSHEAARVAGAFKPHERPVLRSNIAAGGEWLREFARHFPE
jgi:hypothetical protein